jgi:thiamine monophosphate synthase
MAYTTAGYLMAELLEARRVLAEAKAEEAKCMAILRQHTEAEQMLKEAEEIKERCARFKQALTFGKKANLAELQAIMADKG